MFIADPQKVLIKRSCSTQASDGKKAVRAMKTCKRAMKCSTKSQRKGKAQLPKSLQAPRTDQAPMKEVSAQQLKKAQKQREEGCLEKGITRVEPCSCGPKYQL